MKLFAIILLSWAVPAFAGDLCGLLLSSAIAIKSENLSNYGIILDATKLQADTRESTDNKDLAGRLTFYSEFSFFFEPTNVTDDVSIFGPSGHFLMRIRQSDLRRLDSRALTTWLTQIPLQNSRARGDVDQLSILNDQQIVASAKALDHYIFTLKRHDGTWAVKTYGLNPQAGKPTVRLEDLDFGPDSVRATEVNKRFFGTKRQRLIFGETVTDPAFNYGHI